MNDISGFILAAFALVGSPGPATLSLAATGAAFGARRGLGYLLGIEVGMIIIMVITASGVMGMLLAVPRVAPIVTGLSGVYILYLAYQIATATAETDDRKSERHPSFLAGLFLSLVNPKAYASMAALYSGFVLIEDHFLNDALIKGLVLVVILTAVDVAWLLAGSRLMRRIKAPTTRRFVNISFAALLVVAVVFAMV